MFGLNVVFLGLYYSVCSLMLQEKLSRPSRDLCRGYLIHMWILLGNLGKQLVAVDFYLGLSDNKDLNSNVHYTFAISKFSFFT